MRETKTGLVSALCASCNRPEWNWRHFPDHPVNVDSTETHIFVVPGTAVVVPEQPTVLPDFTYGGNKLVRDLLIVSLFVLPIFALCMFFEAVTP